jgi:hypothetical protein
MAHFSVESFKLFSVLPQLDWSVLQSKNGAFDLSLICHHSNFVKKFLPYDESNAEQ